MKNNKFKIFKRGIIFIFSAIVILLAIYFLRECPSNKKDWSPREQRIPYTRIEGDIITFYNVRNFKYSSPENFRPAYYDLTLDIKRLLTIDLIIEPFAKRDGLTHKFLSFGFSDGEHLAFSIGRRFEKGEKYNYFNEFFQQYELMYQIVDEKDLLDLSVNHQKEKTFIYPLKANSEQRRKMFFSILSRINELYEKPEFYHAITNNENINFANHFKHLRESTFPNEYQLIWPGYFDEHLYDLGLIDSKLNFIEQREDFLINEWVQKSNDKQELSKNIRKLE